MAVKSEDQRASYTIKISRLVRDHIQKKTTLSEPVDRTLRRLLGLKLQKGEFSPLPKKPSAGAKKSESEWTTIKITELLWNHIRAKGEWNKSVDHALRRLLKLELGELAVKK